MKHTRNNFNEFIERFKRNLSSSIVRPADFHPSDKI